jgi:hypothetical protein
MVPCGLALGLKRERIGADPRPVSYIIPEQMFWCQEQRSIFVKLVPIWPLGHLSLGVAPTHECAQIARTVFGPRCIWLNFEVCGKIGTIIVGSGEGKACVHKETSESWSSKTSC